MSLKAKDGQSTHKPQRSAVIHKSNAWSIAFIGTVAILCLVLWQLTGAFKEIIVVILTLLILIYVAQMMRGRTWSTTNETKTELDIVQSERSSPFAQAASYDYSSWNLLYEQLPMSAVLTRADGVIVTVNKAFRDHIGLSFNYNGLTWAELLEDRYLSPLVGAIYNVSSKRIDMQLELTAYHKEGFRQDWLARLVPCPVGFSTQNDYVIVYLQDTNSNRHMAEKIHYMSYYDDMTGLPNRRMFMQRLEESARMNMTVPTSLAVVYMDLDRFKRINDTFGSDFGDMLLMLIAERLLRVMTENDMLARMEGDEFACFMTHVASPVEASERVEALMSAMEEPFVLNEVPVHVTMSVGVFLSGVNEATLDSAIMMVKQADTALSRVKEKGKNGYLFYAPEMNNRPLERLTLEHEMRKALSEGQFQLYYQPQVDMRTKRIVGVEALVRWMHPERGVILPGEFIPLAEENGFIVALGEWVLEEACHQNKRWQDEGLPQIPVSVNLSVRQFEQHNLTKTVEQVLAFTGLMPQYLDLEITESMTLDVSRATHVLNELKEMGVGISIDDFGTGYSSLHYLKNFPIHRLKIDRSFVRDLQQDPNDAAIVSAIIALGHTMNMQVIAEGVENSDQLQFLQDHACDEIQGYFFSPPLPVESFEVMLRKQSA
ncbi:bifunctional diguanylate cyclase/phosphodiesterase [Paenibacillus sp. ACRRX]|uniref:putative bifunctional diguanylate cyclase/phosphodiesterase n=1 Tax=unclassified Paenibacillus TaxID=185978 RepID=UPI001EF6AF08|nr:MULTISPECIES: bifunctional diguanylate cyclase/phosphodiesterase [unclassified Paenibacillus]MCG7405819.1 bifunctional diguanylate cyclase/phosphodiesterase [Paenibacillus sp. ACRRX]MDK8182264.1 bifunctional diguanylate cyclase/phosphodiesterase [Paenibacillus sp. UMB4589-SE434]